VGNIYLDSIDLKEWDEASLHSRMSVVFQDFNRYHFLLRENITLGSIEHSTDEIRLNKAVERGGVNSFLPDLPKGLDSHLGRWFKEGTELSGGQWQKVALSRAFIREEANILILDEPTAALDSEAEFTIFERFRELTKGRTTILISHRFPTVRMADTIILIESGKIIEQGSHAELVKFNGRYAQFFEAQAKGYLSVNLLWERRSFRLSSFLLGM
jgi:ATP-binding cassette subfamily B protein